MANKTIQLSDGTNNLYPSIYRTKFNGSQSIPSGETAVLTGSASISAGTWMIIAYVSWGSHSNTTYNVNILWNGSVQRTVRAQQTNGGGVVNTVVIAPTVSGTITLSVYQTSGSNSTANYYVDLIKLS